MHANVIYFSGTPNPNLMDAMKHEHASEETFTTVNYKITTSPSKEWDLVCVHKQCEEIGREIPDYKKLYEQKKCEIERSIGLKDVREEEKIALKRMVLSEEEIIAIILYTGPMVRFKAFKNWYKSSFDMALLAVHNL